jgi:hypothetical protein
MVNKPKILGTQWESAGRDWLHVHGLSGVERMAQQGSADRGDLNWVHPLWGRLVCEMKNTQKIDLPQFMREVTEETKNAGSEIGFAWVKARRQGIDKSFIVMYPETLLKLLDGKRTDEN